MTVLNNDLFFVNIDGVSYRATVGETAVNNEVPGTAHILVNRQINNVWQSFKLPVSRLRTADFGNNDLFLINRNGASYKATGSEIKAKLIVRLESVTLAKVDCGSSRTCFDISITAENPFPDSPIVLSCVPRVFSSFNSIFYCTGISSTNNGFVVNSVSQTSSGVSAFPVGSPGSFSADRKTAVIRWEFTDKVSFNSSQVSCKTLFGAGNVVSFLNSVQVNGNQSNASSSNSVATFPSTWP